MSEQPTKRTRRNRRQTEETIIAAARALISEQGFAAAGVNAIAERAGVNKVLIYRYFGGIEGLYQAVARHADVASLHFAAQLVERMDPTVDLRLQLAAGFRSLRSHLAADEFSLELMIHELRQENDLTRAFAGERERIGTAATAALSVALSRRPSKRHTDTASVGADMEARVAIVMAALYYLVLRARNVTVFNAIDIGSEAGWERLCNAMAEIVLA